MVIDVTDGWLLQGAWLPPDPIDAFTLANVAVSLMTAKLGVLLRDIQDAQGATGWFDHVRVLVDLGVAVGEDDDRRDPSPGARPAAGRRPRPGRGAARPRLGPRRAGVSCPSLWFPEDVKLTAFEVVQLEVEELAFVNEDNGGRYLAVQRRRLDLPGRRRSRSGRSPRHGTPGVPAEGQPQRRRHALPAAAAAHRRQRRWRRRGCSTGSACSSRSAVRAERVGQRSPTSPATATATSEFGLGLLLRFRAMGKDFSIGAQLVLRPRHRAGGQLHLLAVRLPAVYCPGRHASSCAASACWSPAACRRTSRSRADAPRRCGCSTGTSSTSASGAVEVRSDRSQQRGGWKVEQGAEAAGVGADLVPVGEQER